MGRKSKNAIAQPTDEVKDTNPVETPNLNDAIDMERKSKKRGRKPKEKYNFDTSSMNFDMAPDPLSESIIVKLPIAVKDATKSSTIFNSLMKYNPDMDDPMPYDPLVSNFTAQPDKLEEANANKHKKIKKYDEIASVDINDLDIDQYSSKNMVVDFDKKDTAPKKIEPKQARLRQIDVLLQNKYKNETKIPLMVEFKNRDVCEKTDIHCLWCCHQFDNTPWGIPLEYVKHKFHLFGVYCSSNCAASYIFNEMKDTHNVWELYSLLNLLYYRIHKEHSQIMLAPSKLCLERFGGQVKINDFRKMNLNSNSIFPIKFPPMVSVIPVMEEVNLQRTQPVGNFTKDDNDMVKMEGALKIQRFNPLSGKQTLNSML